MQAGHARCWSEEGPPLLIQIDKSNLPLGLRLRLLRLLTARLVLKPRRVVSYHHVLLLHVEPRDPQAREQLKAPQGLCSHLSVLILGL